MDKKWKNNNHRSKKSFKVKLNSTNENRRICDCEATKHMLVNNCTYCGRIVCSSEGSGPCLFCNQMVNCYYKQTSSIMKQTKPVGDSNRVSSHNTLDSVNTIKLRDKLLECDKDGSNRTNVIDDECDYYQANNIWLNKKQREEWKKLELNTFEKKHKSRLLQNLEIDFTGRIKKENEECSEFFHKMNVASDDNSVYFSSLHTYNNQFESLKSPVYLNDIDLPANSRGKIGGISSINNRIQDKSYLEISDQGVCLSLHQPYASLLVKGIKTTEGRTWYTSHRGRIWIASTIKEPNAAEISAMEEMYRLSTSRKIDFPKTYPTGCLLGCITITDVLSREEYDKQHSHDKVDSPYIFICENFFELPIKYPIQGKHKIYKLDSIIHRAAINCLEKVSRKLQTE